ncbi:MAG: hypothetical protein IJZ72_03360 [Oscillospiraceae bacterium]|nr:hypothetical protein [Oscillospiraceae bacterium]
MYSTENAARIEKIFTDMMEFPLHCLNFSRFGEFFPKINAVSLKDRAHISYGDALFLLWYLPDSPSYESYDRREREEIRNGLLRELFMALRATMNRSDTVEKFMSLTIDEYLYYISGGTERAEERIKADIEYYREKTLCCPKYELSEGVTLKDLAHRTEALGYRCKGTSEEEHKKLVHSCNEDLYYFLIKYVRKKFYSVFDVSIQCE